MEFMYKQCEFNSLTPVLLLGLNGSRLLGAHTRITLLLDLPFEEEKIARKMCNAKSGLFKAQ